MYIFFQPMFKIINSYILILFIIRAHCSINDDFKQAKYIKDFNSYEEYQEAFKNNELKYGFLLMYNSNCGFCIKFSSNYIALSEIYHDHLFFYSVGTDHGKYTKDFDIRGFPTILFYNNGSYSEYNQKRGINKISLFIKNYIPFIGCTEISYKNIQTVLDDIYQKNDRNLLIGFFNEKKIINSFINLTNDFINEYLDYCYYIIRNESTTERPNEIFLNMKENEIWTINRIKGENTFIFNENNYKQNLFKNVINIYEDINNENKLNLLKRMKNKDYILFIYNDDNMKNEYINKIIELYNLGKDEIFFKYYYILFNKFLAKEKYENLEINKIYHVSNDFENKIIIEDLNKYLYIDTNNKPKLKITEKINNNINSISSVDKINILRENISNINEKEGIIDRNNKNESISNSIKNIQIINEIKIETKEENLTIKDSKKIHESESTKEEQQNNQIIPKLIDIEIKEENSPINENKKTNKTAFNDTKNMDKEMNHEKNGKNFYYEDIRKKIKNRRFNFTMIKNKINKMPKEKIIHNEIKDENTKNIHMEYDDDDVEEQSSNKIIKLLIVICIMVLVIYYIATRYLCVGFVKSDDNQVIEFNNQANKIEII